MKRWAAIAALSVLLSLFTPIFLRSQDAQSKESCYFAVVEWHDATGV